MYRAISIDEFDASIKSAKKQAEFVRLTVMRSLFLGVERKTVCLIFNKSERTLQFWIERFLMGKALMDYLLKASVEDLG